MAFVEVSVVDMPQEQPEDKQEAPVTDVAQEQPEEQPEEQQEDPVEMPTPVPAVDDNAEKFFKELPIRSIVSFLHQGVLGPEEHTVCFVGHRKFYEKVGDSGSKIPVSCVACKDATNGKYGVFACRNISQCVLVKMGNDVKFQDQEEKPRDRIKEALLKTPEGHKKVACKECDSCKKKKACSQPKFVEKPAKKAKSSSSSDLMPVEVEIPVEVKIPVEVENPVEEIPLEVSEARVGLKLD